MWSFVDKNIHTHPHTLTHTHWKPTGVLLRERRATTFSHSTWTAAASIILRLFLLFFLFLYPSLLLLLILFFKFNRWRLQPGLCHLALMCCVLIYLPMKIIRACPKHTVECQKKMNRVLSCHLQTDANCLKGSKSLSMVKQKRKKIKH